MDQEQEIRTLREQLQANQKKMEDYQNSCKQVEEFLEKQSQEKTQQIKKLKEQAIKKEKAFNMLKTQCKQYQAQLQTLKEQMKKVQQQPIPVDDSQKDKDIISKKNQQLAQKDKVIAQLKDNITVLNKDLGNSKNQYNQLSIRFNKLEKQLQQSKIDIQLSKTAQSQTKNQTKPSPKTQKKQDSKVEQQLSNKLDSQKKKVNLLEKQISEADNKYKQLEKQLESVKMKCQKLSHEKNQLKNQIKDMEHSPDKIKVEQSPKYQSEQQDIEQQHSTGLTNFYSLILTKKHFTSPFLEIKDKSNIKLYKHTKNGFQKSLGSKKYKMNLITYELDSIVQKCVEGVKNLSYLDTNSQSIYLIGQKKSMKKYIMANIVEKLSDSILKLSEEHQIEVIFSKRSSEDQKNITMEGRTKQEIKQILEIIIQMKQKNSSKSTKKGLSKPKIRYFAVKLGQTCFQIITSSHTSNTIRDNMSLMQGINQLIYNKFSDQLQHVNSNKQIIFTLNPVIQHYEDCKNILALAACKQGTAFVKTHEKSMEQLPSSPRRDQPFMNDVIKKKIQHQAKQNQQQSLRIRKLDQQCHFYRNRFDQLQGRLKNLLNTHGHQNTYLKKSPTTLSFEKLLKFVNNVMARNGSCNRNDHITINNNNDSDDEPII